MAKKSKHNPQFKSRQEQQRLNAIFKAVSENRPVPDFDKPVKRGEVYYIHESATRTGGEVEKTRPGVIISTNDINNKLYTVTVVYLTSTPKDNNIYHTVINVTGQPSTVMAEHINDVDITRIGNYCGMVSPDEMERIEECVRHALCLPCAPEVNVEDVSERNTAESTSVTITGGGSATELLAIEDKYRSEIAALRIKLTEKEVENKILNTMYENLLSKVLAR